MKQEAGKRGFRDRLSQYFKFLCTGQPHKITAVAKPQEVEARRSAMRKRRVTFQLDSALVKLTRRNIQLDEFQSAALPAGLQAHLGTRLASLTFVHFQGNFTHLSTKPIPFPTRTILQQPPYFTPSNDILLRPNQPLRLRGGTLDCLVTQISHPSSAVLESYLSDMKDQVSHFVFVCLREVQLDQLGALLAAHRDHFLFEVERIMNIDKCLGTVVYVSRSGEFLNVEDEVLADFYLQEMAKRDPAIERLDLAELLLALMASNLYVEVASAMVQLFQKQQAVHLDRDFIYLMHHKYANSHKILDGFMKNYARRESKVKEEVVSQLPEFQENTPLFRHARTTEDEKERRESWRGSLRPRRTPEHSFGLVRAMTSWQD